MTRAGDLEVTLEPLPRGGAVVRVLGELDLATLPELEGVLGGLDLGQRVIIDLSACTFLDSAALRVLIATIRLAETRGGSVSLVSPEPGVARVLEIAAIDTMVPVHATLEAAL